MLTFGRDKHRVIHKNAQCYGKKSYKWFFDLEENVLTTEVTNDYTAQVRTLMSKDIPMLAAEIVKERTEYRENTVVNIANLLFQKIREEVAGGNIVVTPAAIFQPSILGTFVGKGGAFDATKHKCTVNITPSDAMRKELEEVVPEFSGNVRDMGGARIALVTDSVTSRTDGFMTPGNTIDITGRKIRCINADGSGMGKVCFVDADTDSEAASITSLSINTPSHLMLVVPASLPEGTYRLEITTYYSNSSTCLKTPRTLVYEPLYVGEVPESGGDDEDDERPGGL